MEAVVHIDSCVRHSPVLWDFSDFSVSKKSNGIRTFFVVKSLCDISSVLVHCLCLNFFEEGSFATFLKLAIVSFVAGWTTPLHNSCKSTSVSCTNYPFPTSAGRDAVLRMCCRAPQPAPYWKNVGIVGGMVHGTWGCLLRHRWRWGRGGVVVFLTNDWHP